MSRPTGGRDPPHFGYRPAQDDTDGRRLYGRAVPIELMPEPSSGRVYTNRLVTRMGDMTATNRLRFDAVARCLQDLAADDSDDSGLPDPNNWVVKWYVIHVAATCEFRERLNMATWASGAGSRWAERRSRFVSQESGRAVVEAAALWVRIDGETGRPRKLNPEFYELYGEAAGDRKPPTKLGQPTTVPHHAATREWKPRASDMDLLGHVNNAAYFQIVEEALGDRSPAPMLVELEYRTPIDSIDPVQLHITAPANGAATDVDLWVASGDDLHMTAQIRSSDLV